MTRRSRLLLPQTRSEPEYEIAYVENATTVKQALAAPPGANVTGLIMVIPPQERSLWIKAHLLIDQTAAVGAASSANIEAFIMDEDDNYYGHQSVTLGAASGTNGSPVVEFEGRVGPTTEEHTFRIVAAKSGNANFAGDIMHGSLVPAYKSWMAAYLR